MPTPIASKIHRVKRRGDGHVNRSIANGGENALPCAWFVPVGLAHDDRTVFVDRSDMKRQRERHATGNHSQEICDKARGEEKLRTLHSSY